jgi:DnaJ like chaperone protein
VQIKTIFRTNGSFYKNIILNAPNLLLLQNVQLKGKIWAGVAGIFIGDLLGLPLGGLTGFIVFSILGHYFFDIPREQEELAEDNREYRQRQGRFIYFLMALGAKLAKADGPVNRLERDMVERIMRDHFHLSGPGRAEAIHIWNTVKDNSESFERYALQFNEQFSRERYQINNMLDLLFMIAAADGGLHRQEELVLRRVAHFLRISPLQFERIKQRYYISSANREPAYSTLDPHYAILGAKPTDTMEDIKKKYRQLALEWHPDRLVAAGASQEAIRHGKEKFQLIKEAYDKITASRTNTTRK